MTARARLAFFSAAFVCSGLAAWGAHEILASLFDPIIRSLGA